MKSAAPARMNRVQAASSNPSPAYDLNGNLKSYKGRTYTYDAQNRLTTVRSNGTLIATFYYDGKNRQIARNINGVIRFSAWDNWELLEEYALGLTPTTSYLQGANGVIKSWGSNGTIYYYQDKLGSTTHIADANGTLLESYHYDLYGTPTYYDPLNNQLSTTHYSVNDLYAGERWIPELGLYDLRNRFMSPELGRFLQADPIGFKGDASNLYRYCGNDPVVRTDPMGLSDLNYIPPWQAMSGQADRYRNEKDIIIVSAHGTTGYIINSNQTKQAYADGFYRNIATPVSMRLSVEQLVREIKALKKYTPTITIKLDICKAGDFAGAGINKQLALAQQVANGLGTNPVIANTGFVNAKTGDGTGTNIPFWGPDAGHTTVLPSVTRDSGQSGRSSLGASNSESRPSYGQLSSLVSTGGGGWATAGYFPGGGEEGEGFHPRGPN